jgi:uncharacterized membrane protein (UPF0127 family)/DNA-binding CsgD family transcriptional regulator
LSPREWEILEELSRGATNPEIAKSLGVSVHTVKSHVKLILLKLDVANRTAAAAWFERHCGRPNLLATKNTFAAGRTAPSPNRRRIGSLPGLRKRRSVAPAVKGNMTTALVRASGRDLCVVEVADNHVARAVGLLGRKELPMGHGMWIKPCKSIHTFFLRFSIDVAYIAADGTVVKTCAHLRPFRVSVGGLRAHSVLELPSGFLERAALRAGEMVSFSPATKSTPTDLA